MEGIQLSFVGKYWEGRKELAASHSLAADSKTWYYAVREALLLVLREGFYSVSLCLTNCTEGVKLLFGVRGNCWRLERVIADIGILRTWLPLC